MSILDRVKHALAGGNEPSPPPPGSPPYEGVALTGGDPTIPENQGISEVKVDPPMPESERKRASDTDKPETVYGRSTTT